MTVPKPEAILAVLLAHQDAEIPAFNVCCTCGYRGDTVSKQNDFERHVAEELTKALTPPDMVIIRDSAGVPVYAIEVKTARPPAPGEPWTDDRIREGFIYDGGESEYHDPIHGTQTQRAVAGDIFDRWLTAHDESFEEKLMEAKAVAWAKGRQDGLYDGLARNHVPFDARVNPYRKPKPCTASGHEGCEISLVNGEWWTTHHPQETNA